MSLLFEDAEVKALAREESVRGTLVRLVLEQAGAADAEEKVVLEEALGLLLEKFHVVVEDAS